MKKTVQINNNSKTKKNARRKYLVMAAYFRNKDNIEEILKTTRKY